MEFWSGSITNFDWCFWGPCTLLTAPILFYCYTIDWWLLLLGPLILASSFIILSQSTLNRFLISLRKSMLSFSDSRASPNSPTRFYSNLSIFWIILLSVELNYVAFVFSQKGFWRCDSLVCAVQKIGRSESNQHLGSVLLNVFLINLHLFDINGYKIII